MGHQFSNGGKNARNYEWRIWNLKDKDKQPFQCKSLRINNELYSIFIYLSVYLSILPNFYINKGYGRNKVASNIYALYLAEQLVWRRPMGYNKKPDSIDFSRKAINHPE